jgi:hypothetical protein
MDIMNTMVGNAPRPTIVCLGCGYLMTWAEQRRQFGRLIRLGLGRDEAKARMPRCRRCITADQRQSGPAGAGPVNIEHKGK